MKIILLSLSLIYILNISCKAQTIYPLGTYDIPETTYYVKDVNNHHNDIVGTWKWEEGNSSFEIILQEFEAYKYPTTSNESRDAIFGKYKYIVDNTLITEVTTIDLLPNLKLFLSFESPTSYNVIIKDLVSETSKTGTFILNSATSATLRLWNSEGVKFNYGNGQSWALPTSLTLTKVN